MLESSVASSIFHFQQTGFIAAFRKGEIQSPPVDDRSQSMAKPPEQALAEE
jgi:hypothetical protein